MGTVFPTVPTQINPWFQSIRDLYQKKHVLILSVLDMTVNSHVKKAVICVAELVAALVSVSGLLSFVPDVYCLLHLPG